MSSNKSKNLVSRPPVVVILGHVDTGKTTILDYIRKTRVAQKEAGSITQHIGAYQISVGDKEREKHQITFIDTPGHEAFSAMRSRGAKIADLAVLVVAGDQGVMPQTEEALSHIRKAEIPMVVAINKMDLPSADSSKVKTELSEHKILVESRGGQTPCVEISAKTGEGIPDLLEMISLVAQMEKLEVDLKASPRGAVVEAYMDHKRGPVATLIPITGILEIGDIVGTSSSAGKIKSLEDFKGESIKKVFPSQPAVVLGFNGVVRVGDKFKVFSDLESAQKKVKPRFEGFEEKVMGEGKKTLNLILKADVLGSLEAIEDALKSLSLEEVKLKILKAKVGNISEDDLKLALSTQARILGFRVNIDSQASKLAQNKDIRVRRFEVIYDLIEGVRKLISSQKSKKIIRKKVGRVKVLETFGKQKGGQIVGGRVQKGKVVQGAKIEVWRGEKIGEGKLVNLQQNKKDVGEVNIRQECGILFKGEVDIQPGDKLVIYTRKKKKDIDV